MPSDWRLHHGPLPLPEGEQLVKQKNIRMNDLVNDRAHRSDRISLSIDETLFCVSQGKSLVKEAAAVNQRGLCLTQIWRLV